MTDDSPTLRLDLTGRNPPPCEFGPIQPGDIMQTRQGKLYLIVSVPGPSREWRTSECAYYFTLNHVGEVQRSGQVLLGYAEANWFKVGRCDISISDPEWF